MPLKINKNLNKMKGVLETAGLGEFSYYMKKSGQYAQYAEYALENTNVDSLKGAPTSLKQKIDALRRLAAEIVYEIEQLPAQAIVVIEDIEVKDLDDENEEKAKDSKGSEDKYGIQ